MEAEQTVVFIHGIGDRPDSWAHQVRELPTGYRGVTLEVPGLGTAPPASESFTLDSAASSLVSRLDQLGIERAHVCGLSLGAMLAFRIAVDHPDRVRSLTLAAGQVKPPRALMAIQNFVMRLLPEKLMAPDGVSKAQLLEVVQAVARADFSRELSSVAAPTLVLCGSRDRANLPASRAIADGIPGAQLRVIDGAGHESNTQTPELFSAALNGFLTQLPDPDAKRKGDEQAR